MKVDYVTITDKIQNMEFIILIIIWTIVKTAEKLAKIEER